jgi:hypothetical protein
MTDDDWQPMDTIPEDGSAVLCKLKSGHVIVTWSEGEWEPGVHAWLSEMTDFYVGAVLDDDDIPDTSDENRIGWKPYSGPHPADPPKKTSRSRRA